MHAGPVQFLCFVNEGIRIYTRGRHLNMLWIDFMNHELPQARHAYCDVHNRVPLLRSPSREGWPINSLTRRWGTAQLHMRRIDDTTTATEGGASNFRRTIAKAQLPSRLQCPIILQL